MEPHTLTITDEDEVEILKLQIRPLSAEVLAPAICAALASIPDPKKPRKDKGTKRTAETK